MSASVKTMSEFSLHELERRIEARAGASADVSYTSQLLERGVAHCAKKLGEESIECIMAAVGDSRERVIGEAADLLHHLLVVLKARGVSLAEVESALERRSMQSGLAEKSSRQGT